MVKRGGKQGTNYSEMNFEPVQSFNCKKLNSQTEAQSGVKS